MRPIAGKRDAGASRATARHSGDCPKMDQGRPTGHDILLDAPAARP